MLSCKVGNTNINVIDYEEKQLRSWSKRGLLKCPVCGEKLVYKHGLVRIPHFSHEKDKECTYTYFENETKEHASGKVILYKFLKSNIDILNLELEDYIPETKQKPDLSFNIGDQKYVIEYQCSPLLLSEFKERRELYKLAGIKDIWIFGSEKYKFSNNGKLKMKAAEEDWWLNQQRIYYLNPFEETLHKFYRVFDFEYRFPMISTKLDNKCDFNIVDFEILFGTLEYEKEDENKLEQDSAFGELKQYKFIITNDYELLKEKRDYFLNRSFSGKAFKDNVIKFINYKKTSSISINMIYKYLLILMKKKPDLFLVNPKEIIIYIIDDESKQIEINKIRQVFRSLNSIKVSSRIILKKEVD